MSIEAALAALTAELKRNSDLLETITTTAAKNMKAAAPADEKAPVDKPAGKPAGKPAADKAPPKRKVPTPAEMAKATTDFLEVEDEGEYNKRRALVKAIVNKHGVKKMSEIEEGERIAASDALVAYKAGDATGYEAEEEEESMA